MIVDVTTKCPTCGKEFTRETYLECVFAGMGLELCPECDTGEEVIMVGNPDMFR